MWLEFIPDLMRHSALLGIVVVCAYTDLSRRRIYDRATLPAIAAGLMLNAAAGGVGYPGISSGPGLTGSAVAILCGGLLFLWFFMRGAVTGGDVKYVCAVCSLGGMEHFFALKALFLSSLVGGAMALGVMIRQGEALKNLAAAARFAVEPSARAIQSGLTVPYGLAVSAGTLWAWLMVYVL